MYSNNKHGQKFKYCFCPFLYGGKQEQHKKNSHHFVQIEEEPMIILSEQLSYFKDNKITTKSTDYILPSRTIKFLANCTLYDSKSRRWKEMTKAGHISFGLGYDVNPKSLKIRFQTHWIAGQWIQHP